ncbi:GNAT family N-acetyltransferase [Streptomyces sp. NPDC051214]|uniref:GNAT family N-acetyltransferase n=1 Tax=Streptomyces sp. NPDC051214 TaxID=3155282 RepID=UPI0034140371
MAFSPYAGWQLTSDLDEFLSRAAAFLHSAPALHTALLSVSDTLRVRGLHVYGEKAPLFGIHTDAGPGEASRPAKPPKPANPAMAGKVTGAFLWTPPHLLALSPLPDEAAAEELAGVLADAGFEPAGVGAESATAARFAAAWERRTKATATVNYPQRLYRLGTLTPPEPAPAGGARVATDTDRELLMRWHGEFHEALGEKGAMGAGEWADARIAYGGVTLWETPDGTPAAMAGNTRRVAGQVRVAPVYTPAHLRGRGYAGAVTAEVSRAALAAGADEVLLFTDADNPTSNALYQRLGYRPLQDFTQYTFTH